MTTPITHPAHPDLIAFWSMDRLQGNVMEDLAGNYPATAVNVTVGAGFIGNAAYMAGNGSLDTGLVSFAPSAMTYSTWVYFDVVSNTLNIYYPLCSSRDATGTTGFFTYQVSPANSATGKTALRPHINTSTGLKSFDTAFEPGAGSWYHVLIEYSASTGLLKIEIDGVPDPNFASGGGSILGTTNSLLIGACRTEEESFARFDNTRIFNRLLTAAEKAELLAEQPKLVSGTVVVNGSPVVADIRIYDEPTGKLLTTVTSGADGTYSVPLVTYGDVYITAIPPAGYQAITHGPITPLEAA